MIRQLIAQGMTREQVIDYLVQRGYPPVEAAMLYDIEMGEGGDLIAVAEDGTEYYPDRPSLVD